MYEAALRQEPDCAEAIFNMGVVAKALAQYDLALEQLVMLNGMLANQVMLFLADARTSLLHHSCVGYGHPRL